MRFSAMKQFVGDLQNDVAPFGRCIKNTGAISESTLLFAEFIFFQSFEVEHFYGFDCVRDFLPVCADVLDGSSAYSSRNPTEALDAGTIVSNCSRDKRVPVL